MNRLFYFLSLACLLLIFAILFTVMGLLIYQGSSGFTYFYRTWMEVGEIPIIWHLIGTLILIVTAWALALPFSLALALWQQYYLENARLKGVIKQVLLVLNAVPTIVLGLFGYLIFVQQFNWGKSWLIGGIILAMSMLPSLTLTVLERMQAIPLRYTEAALGLGMKTSQLIWRVIWPQSAGSLITGSLLTLSRAAGETAPLIFTACVFSGVTWPQGVKDQPVLSLPYHIFTLAQDSTDPQAPTELWGSALLLVTVVSMLSLIALPLRLRMHHRSYESQN